MYLYGGLLPISTSILSCFVHTEREDNNFYKVLKACVVHTMSKLCILALKKIMQGSHQDERKSRSIIHKEWVRQQYIVRNILEGQSWEQPGVGSCLHLAYRRKCIFGYIKEFMIWIFICGLSCKIFLNKRVTPAQSPFLLWFDHNLFSSHDVIRFSYFVRNVGYV